MNLVKFTDEILYGKLHFLCSDRSAYCSILRTLRDSWDSMFKLGGPNV